MTGSADNHELRAGNSTLKIFNSSRARGASIADGTPNRWSTSRRGLKSPPKNDVGREGEVNKLKSYEQLSADECLETLRQAHGTHDVATSGEQKDVGREGESDKLKLYEQRSAGEQFGYASSFDIHVAASSGEEKDVGREGVKKAAVALRMAKFLINVDEIFDDERLAGTDKVRHIREKSRTPEKRLTTRW
jgi:hypothetical protein